MVLGGFRSFHVLVTTHGHFLRVMAEILLAPEPNYKLKY